MRNSSMLLVALGITAVEKGCGKSLGNILAGSVANIIPGTINDTVIGAEASSGSTSLFGCGSDGLKCGESEECLECMEHIFFSEDDGEESDGGNDGDDDLTCDERQDLYCGMDHKDSCLENNEYVTWWECVADRADTNLDCTFDGTCSGAMAVAGSSGGMVVFSAIVAGLLSAGMGMT